MSTEPTPPTESGMSSTPPIESGVSSTPVMSSAATDVNQLASRVAALETRLPANSWLFGNNFLKRAFAMWGHVFVAGLIIGVVVWIVAFACTLLFGFSVAGLMNR